MGLPQIQEKWDKIKPKITENGRYSVTSAVKLFKNNATSLMSLSKDACQASIQLNTYILQKISGNKV